MKERKVTIIIALLISLTTSLGSLFFYINVVELKDEIIQLNKKEQKLQSYDKEIKAREEKVNKNLEDIKIKENEINTRNNELMEKENELELKEQELKLKEQEIAQRIKKSEIGGSKSVYLTFDDGPSQNTEKILDILNTNNINATFFVNGHLGYENTYLRIVNEGNIICNHTYSHNYSEIYSSVESFNKEVDKLNQYLASIGIDKPTIIRFPGGSNNKISQRYGSKDIMDVIIKNQLDKGYDYIDWNVCSGDADKVTEDKDIIIKNVINGCKGKKTAVILFHDSSPKTTTVEALSEIIKYLKDEGYNFRTIGNDRVPWLKFN